MSFRIFNSVLGGHSWTADGRLCITQAKHSTSCQEASPQTEVDALFTRLFLRAKSDRIMARAAKRLRADPSISLARLAAEFGVTEHYMVSGLRAALGVEPQAFLQKANAHR